MAEQPESQPAAVAEAGDDSVATLATLTGQALTDQAAPTSSDVEQVGSAARRVCTTCALQRTR